MIFSLNEMYQLDCKLFGTEVLNEISGVSGSWFLAGSTGTPLNVQIRDMLSALHVEIQNDFNEGWSEQL